jgi:Mg2+ and Co2+ transporter CorA
MGRMSEKSRVTVRVFGKREGEATVWLIVENPKGEEMEAIREVTKARVVRVETVADYLPLHGA